MKTLLILIDGLRPDALIKNEFAQKLIARGKSTMQARTVMPSVTLPCHMSLFHSVDPQRHGTVTNTYMPQVRPIDGLCEVLKKAGKSSAFFINWEELRDLSRPASLHFSYLCRGYALGWDKTNDILTDEAIRCLSAYDVDFTFLYLGYVDNAGHDHGWLSNEYMQAVDNSFANIERIMTALGDEYTYIITADHGGHDRCHGSDMDEDMTIPLIMIGKNFPADTRFEKASIKDIAPTITTLAGIAPDQEWEGTSLI